jgi:uncharacterized protein YodC (DUF2158 family)
MSFKVGEVVKLKSGGPLMTVTAISTSEDRPPSFNCSWFDKDNREQVGSFPADAITRPAPKEPGKLGYAGPSAERNDDGTGWMR